MTQNQTLATLATTDLVISVGSVDGILTTAAVLRLIGQGHEVEVCFTQAFTVNKLLVGSWQGRQVALVDLAVNNRDPEMTRTFVEQLRENGNTLVAVIDEHSREDWLAILGSFDGLAVEPQSQQGGDDAPKSSGEVFRRDLTAAGVEVDDHTLELLKAADAGDRMDFSTHFGAIVNRGVKSAIADDSRRVHLARHLAQNREADSEIQDWISEYEAILVNHQEIIASKQDLGDGIVRVVATDRAVDMSTLMNTLYRSGGRVVIVEGEAFVPAKKRKEVLAAFGTADNLDLMTTIREGGVTPLGGFAQKVNVALEDEAATLAAVRAVLAA
ncbi:hypothetical protein COY93_02295 [Candidatus Uhrbacteria bacterium CG_4_10_14_0_8_um_filter_58_22]|uniref:DHHA1 domain-containing protein n=1 Tax=Candidatus Uhrbacteria bacterium CG_4_10_14_0_8_um_filter_58_22 TaxID=1975029 RepID=A0A2M7QB61_9BACT|nr:MAG: hypothetical protein AUJ19_02500 [Parcubacteria group bacterium CG1_02_58_44]PIY62803.1 MAG: hypothetical protein COY93_02295 [Candidatus Uhrbacteria bacterium CG_4_10_14_0_8_um_filter_58_22]